MDANDLLAFASDTNVCPDVTTFRKRVLEVLAAAVPFDSALFLPMAGAGKLSGAPLRVNKPAGGLQIYFENPRRYMGWSLRSRETAALQQGAYLDYQVFSQRDRDRLPFYADIVRPEGVKKQIVVHLQFRGTGTGAIFVCRHDHAIDFTDEEIDSVRRFLPAIAVAQQALEPRPETASPPPPRRTSALDGLRDRLAALSPRERQLVDLVMRGFRNAEIGEALATSPNTIRNQLSRIFDKLGASSRTELAAWAQSIAKPEE